MRDVNKVLLRGVVSDAPRTKVFDDGRKLVNLNVKTVTMESDETGAMRQRPAWHRVVVRGDRNTEVAEGMAPDSPVYVEGKLRTRKFRNREGEDVYSTEVSADIVRTAETAEPNINRSMVLGNLGQTPELRKFDSFMVMNLRIATSETWSRRDGEQGEQTEWHQVSVYGDLAQRLDGQLEKGQRVSAAGLLQSRKFTDRSGRERRVTETRADTVLSSGNQVRGRSGGSSRRSEGSRSEGSRRGEERASEDPWKPSGVDTDDNGEDVVPF